MQYSYDTDPSKDSSTHLILRNINPIDIILNIIRLAALDKIIGDSLVGDYIHKINYNATYI